MNGLPLLEPAPAVQVGAENRLALEQGIRGLPAEQREVIHLKVFEGRTLQEIAEPDRRIDQHHCEPIPLRNRQVARGIRRGATPMTEHDDFEDVLSTSAPPARGPPCNCQRRDRGLRAGGRAVFSKWMMPLGVCAGVVLMGGTAAVWWRQTQAPGPAPGAPTPASARVPGTLGRVG